jgi:hypothetical protein
MSTQTSFDLTGLSRAIQGRDCGYHLALYADDAEVEIFDAAQPDSPQQVLRGKPAISAWLHGMTSAAVHYEVRDAVVHPDEVTYTEVCRYGDGSSVRFECNAEVRRGQIAHTAVRLVHGPRRSTPAEQPADGPERATARPLTQPSLRSRGADRQLPGHFLG